MSYKEEDTWDLRVKPRCSAGPLKPNSCQKRPNVCRKRPKSEAALLRWSIEALLPWCDETVCLLTC